MYIYGLGYSSLCRIYDLSRSTTTPSHLYSHQIRRNTKKSFSLNNHIFYQTARITIILISFVSLGQLTNGSAIQPKAHSTGQASGKTARAHAKVEEKVDWPLSFGDDSGPVKAPEKAFLPLALSALAAKGDASHADNNKPFPDADLIDMAKLLARRRETPQVKIRNTSELHVDTHNADSKEDGFLNNIPSTVYLQQVVVLQKPFHFHLPILSRKQNSQNHPTEKAKAKGEEDKKRKSRSKSRKSKSLKILVREPDNSMIKREILSQFNEVKALGANSSASNPQSKSVDNSNIRDVDLDHLLKEHPKLIPPVSRKRDSGKLEHHDSMEDDDHHVIGIPLDDDVEEVEQGGSEVLVSKRNIKTIRFSQEAVDSLLGHPDDLIKYRSKIISHAKELDMKPEEAFHLLVFGVPSNQKLAKESNPHEIYERRLKFHQLFLDDSTESEKYHTEVVDKNVSSNKVNPPFNAYMKILKRSKRGLKSWLKKVFKRQPKTTEMPNVREPSEPEPVDCRKKSNNHNKDCATPIKEDIDEKGDSQVDLLLPQALRRSSYLKRRAELRNAVKEEQEIEEEEERSDEKEPTERNEDSEELLRYKKKNEDDDDEDRRKRKRNLKRQSNSKSNRRKRSAGNKLNKIKLISKDEISVVLEMIFNLIEYQCTEISKKGEIMEGLLTITQTTVRSSSLPDYIPKRRSIVDKLFDQMLDCSSNTENLSKWSHYQLKRRSQKKGGDSASSSGRIYRNNGEQILKRKKRVRRDDSTTSTAVELISILGSSTTLPDNLVHDEISTTTEITSVNVSSDYRIVDNESINSVIKLYLIVFKIIPETCFKVDSRLIDESALVLLQEMMKLESNEEYVKEIEDFVGHFDIRLADKLLTECYQNEL